MLLFNLYVWFCYCIQFSSINSSQFRPFLHLDIELHLHPVRLHLQLLLCHSENFKLNMQLSNLYVRFYFIWWAHFFLTFFYCIQVVPVRPSAPAPPTQPIPLPYEELAAQRAALPPLHPPLPINLHAAMEEVRRRDERWMQQQMQQMHQIHDAWRNEQQAQQQQDVEEEERLYLQREEARRDARLEEITNNKSRQAIATY